MGRRCALNHHEANGTMASVAIDGIETRYQVLGDGPALLMYAPGGFDARIEQWTDLGVYKRIKLLDHLPEKYKCILFDRRENGQSGGRVERCQSMPNMLQRRLANACHLDSTKSKFIAYAQ